MKHNHFLESILKYLFKPKKYSISENGRRLVFEYNGRSGHAVYKDGNKTIRFYTEVGGGDCIFYMDIPSTKEWASQTGYPSEQRDEILKFIAEESLRLQSNSPGSYYKIEDKYISFYQK
ncbi:MAG: hypothetical protein KA270_17025 [Saprospiraceae bacterium]|nr:hypothetical protein [Saprospiraceae bacterium]MBP6235390.1 hypothetical protein [Saprospiraceae bacterium]MBP6568880.1 hypothetical protein [Saprospiraceae bacterium]